MRIGTTPTHTFTLPAEIASTVAKVRVIYSQCGQLVLCKDVTQLMNNAAVFRLTQEETLKFHNRKLIDIQLKVLTSSNDVLTSDIFTRTPHECLECEVLA